MTTIERITYLIEIHGAKIGDCYFADFNEPFTFDNGTEVRLLHVDVDADEDCYALFDFDSEKYYLKTDLTDNEVEKILMAICS